MIHLTKDNFMKRIDWKEWLAVLALVFLVPFIMTTFAACFILIGDQLVAGLSKTSATLNANDTFVKILPGFFVLSFIGLCLVALGPISTLFTKIK